MSAFNKYMHIERFGRDEVTGIEDGECLVFPKLDGANGQVWLAESGIACGSRNRDLMEAGADDNHGFRTYVLGHAGLHNLLTENQSWHLHGEWLVPHTLRTYREEAWRRFYVFDVWHRGQERWLRFDEYHPYLVAHGVDYVPPLAKITSPTEADLLKLVAGNTHLIQTGAGVGEGVVVKRYDFQSRFGRTVWAKVVRNEFKEENCRAFGVSEQRGSYQIELDIVEHAVTAALVAKERTKLEGCDRETLIPRLLQTVYHCLVTEELWTELKRLKDPSIDFKKLRRHCTTAVKKLASDLF